jgi:hypothetical protein
LNVIVLVNPVVVKLAHGLAFVFTVQLGERESKIASVAEVGTPLLPEPSAIQFPAVPHKPSPVVFLQIGISL